MNRFSVLLAVPFPEQQYETLFIPSQPNPLWLVGNAISRAITQRERSAVYEERARRTGISGRN